MLKFPKWKIIFVLIACLWGVYQAVPNLFDEQTRLNSSFIGDDSFKLGLDLQGGSHLLLEVDFNHFLNEQMDMLRGDLRKGLSKEKVGYRGLKVKKREDGISYIALDLINNDNFETLSEVAKVISRDFEIEKENEQTSIIYYTDEYLKTLRKNVLEKSIEIVRRRVDETGTREPTIQMQGENRILLQVPGLKDPEGLKDLLGKTAKMTFHLMDDADPFALATTKPKKGYRLLSDIDESSQNRYNVRSRVEISGEQVIDAQPTYDRGQPSVSFKFNSFGGKKFGKITAANVNKPFAIVLDNKVITAPNIRSAILGGSGVINGNFTISEATELAILLRSGALPAPLTIIEERTVGPSLGLDSIEAGKKASFIAIILVMVMMVVIYRLFGVFSTIALFFNLVFIIAVLSLFGATLTLPGIAGIVLTMGMAVDANVLIFERIKEELNVGKTPFAAVDNGFQAAFKTIIDSNITTLIATFLLFTYGSGPIKGFAVTLSVGILCSMFSAILLTRMMMVLWLKKNKPKTLKIR